MYKLPLSAEEIKKRLLDHPEGWHEIAHDEYDPTSRYAQSGIAVAQAINGLASEDYVDAAISAIPTPDVSGQIGTHNTATDAHNDIRLLVDELTTRLETLADSDDTTLDQMSEIVGYIKNNKELIEQVTTNKVNVSDIINNLTTNVTNKPLSAAQGVALKALIDAAKIDLENGTGVESLQMTGSTATAKRAFAEGDETSATATAAHAEGFKTNASAINSHAEGSKTTASGSESHAEGYATKAIGNHSHAEGSTSIAQGEDSHAEGQRTIATGIGAHSEGKSTDYLSNYATLEEAIERGSFTVASGRGAHAEGWDTRSTGYGSHSEGRYTKALAEQSHAEGYMTEANANNAHAEGGSTVASGDNSHAEGSNTIASGLQAHAEGFETQATERDAHAEGTKTVASGMYSHAEGFESHAEGMASHAEGASTAKYDYSHAEGWHSEAKAGNAHAEGGATIASGVSSHSEGENTVASGVNAHAEGNSTEASGADSHAEGYEAIASGKNTHAEGCQTQATNDHAHAEGNETIASGTESHAEGYGSKAMGKQSHAEGGSTQTMEAASWAHAEGLETEAHGTASHAEGYKTKALHNNSHAEGAFTQTSRDNQHVEGQYNKDEATAYHITGCGADADNRDNCFTAGVMSGRKYISVGNTVVTEEMLNDAIYGDDIDTRYDYSFGRDSGSGKIVVYRQLMARQADGTYSKADGVEGSIMFVTDLDDAVREFDYNTGFNWAQFLGEPTFIKVNFPEGKEFYLYRTDAAGNVTPSDPIKPKTLFLNISTEIGDDYKILHLETVVNGRPYRTTMYFNKDTNAVVMTSSTMSPVPDSYSKTEVDTKLKSKIAIYNNVRPSTFKWWEAINYALGNTTIDFSEVQTGAFQLNLASGCYFTGFEPYGYNSDGALSDTAGTRLTSALVSFTVSYYGGGSHELVLTIEHNGDVYRSAIFSSYPGSGTEFNESGAGYGFEILDDIPFTKVTQSAMIVDVAHLSDGSYFASKTGSEIYAHVQNGGTVYAYLDGNYWNLVHCQEDAGWFTYTSDDAFVYVLLIANYGVEFYEHSFTTHDSARWIAEDVLVEKDVAYKSDLHEPPKAIPTSTIDALFS